MPFACGVSAAFPYLFLIGYAAPRFLLPAYAFLALPVADALVRTVRAVSGARRALVVTVLVMGLAGHLAVQYHVLSRTVVRDHAGRDRWAQLATELHRLGVRPPCLVTGDQNIPVAFYAGCRSAAVKGHDANITVAGIRDTARRMPTAVLVPSNSRPPAYARDWSPVRYGTMRVYLAPRPGGSATQ